MRISDEVINRHSEDEFAAALQKYSDSGAGVIHVRTSEIVRATIAVRKTVLLDGSTIKEWDILNGFRDFDVKTMYSFNGKGDGNSDIGAALGAPLLEVFKDAKSDTYQYFVYVNPQYWMEAPVTSHLIQQYSHILPSSPIRIILITPDEALPDTVSENLVTIRFGSPGHVELRESLDTVLSSVSGSSGENEIPSEEKDRICYAGAGMGKDSFDMHVSLAIVNKAAVEGDTYRISPDDIIEGIGEGKTEIINKNDLLELLPTESMSDIGGMENLKEWVAKRSNCYTDDAIDFGIESPKGMVFVGVPGSGKSLAAKAVAKELGVPLVRLDFGRVFNSLVGKSEERMRVALQMVENMAPCVLFCDEIDKGLGGIGGSGDSGTSSRVLGSFLTWLQENKTPVFTMVTANNVDGLPPELLRRGRFDAIFSTSLPSERERREVLAIHLKKRGWGIDEFSKAGVNKIMTASNGYVPSEIESAVKDGLIEAFNNDEDLKVKHILQALDEMVPISKAFEEKIQLMTLWAKNNATPASRPDVVDEKVVSIGQSRRIRTKPKDDKDLH